jgi:hypothetical protein
MMSAADLDQLLLSFCNRRWLKVARIAGKTLDAIEERGTKLDGAFADQIDARMAALVHGGLLDAKGNIKRWRYSEVRLPSGPKEAAKPAPEGGDGGGEIVATGTPEQIDATKGSYTRQFLKPALACSSPARGIRSGLRWLSS